MYLMPLNTVISLHYEIVTWSSSATGFDKDIKQAIAVYAACVQMI